ncbi:hypothetical protein BZL30_3203 [Mycobacterium kansasii]|uniref:Uncharacterized protein n=1 Tax=Mycobacterium kansasii TaxID=1768 RepID=A0A1V3X8H1_MYCKA|nr:hypothetical protein BZL30_3203 [Mycobacterium kansasii]
MNTDRSATCSLPTPSLSGFADMRNPLCCCVIQRSGGAVATGRFGNRHRVRCPRTTSSDSGAAGAHGQSG